MASPASMAAHQRSSSRAAGPAVELAQLGESAFRVGHGLGRRDQGGVGHQAAGCGVESPGRARRGPARALGRRRGCGGLRRRGCPRAGATVRRATASGPGRARPRTPAGRSPTCRPRRAARRSRRAGRPAARRRGRRTRATAAGRGRVDQSAAECSFARWMPSSSSTTVPSPTRGSPRSRAASSVSKMRVGSRPTSRRQVRSWLAACSTHSSSAMASFSSLEAADRRRVEEERAGAAAEDLDEVGALRVLEAGRALGVDGDRAGAGGDRGDGVEVLVAGVDDDGAGQLTRRPFVGLTASAHALARLAAARRACTAARPSLRRAP